MPTRGAHGGRAVQKGPPLGPLPAEAPSRSIVINPAVPTNFTSGSLPVVVQLSPDQPLGPVKTDALLVPLPPDIDRTTAARAVSAAIDSVTTVSRVRAVVEAAAEAVPPAVLTAIAEQDQRWREIEARYGLLDSTQVSDVSGSQATNRAEYASNLHRRHKALAVRRNGRLRFPGFQFDRHGRVYPVIPEIIDAMSGEGWSSESIILWMDSPNGYFGGQTPIDCIEDTDAVLDAAINAAHTAE